MKVSEKTLELNVSAELLAFLRGPWNYPKTYLRGLTQQEERAEGVDVFAQLNESARIAAFQFKAPRGTEESAPYKYTLMEHQHRKLRELAAQEPGIAYYVFPFYRTPEKVLSHVPNLAQDTWLLPIDQMNEDIFQGAKTRTISCTPGAASVNPEFSLYRLSEVRLPRQVGVPARRFARWYSNLRRELRFDGRATRSSPWLVRGLRVVVIGAEPES